MRGFLLPAGAAAPPIWKFLRRKVHRVTELRVSKVSIQSIYPKYLPTQPLVSRTT
jgi:hypothetical protein